MKRASLTKRERAAMHASQGGLCGCGCDRPLGERYIAEHVWCVAMGNESKPDALYRADCAAEKTRNDIKLISKTKRQSGKITGQQARRARRKEEGRAPLIRSNPAMQSRGFDRTKTKKMDGRVVEKTNGKRIPSVRRDRRGLAQEAGAPR